MAPSKTQSRGRTAQRTLRKLLPLLPSAHYSYPPKITVRLSSWVVSCLLWPHRAAHEDTFPILSSVGVGVGRTSPFSITSTRILTATLLVSFLPAVRADCYINGDGYEVCDGLSPGARAGIGIAIFALFLLAITAMLAYRRRRANRANLAYIHQTQQGGGGMYGNPYGPPPPQPQYPPQTYNSADPSYPYDPRSGFAPVRLRLSSLLLPLLLMPWTFSVVARGHAASVLSAPTRRPPPSPEVLVTMRRLVWYNISCPERASMLSFFPLL
ncbi:hypothetical protein BJV74DRAFT_954523 [Russula compacta]|nr:hypothetical protein BJV74DRAFT_954523 [Russula compacta]